MIRKTMIVVLAGMLALLLAGCGAMTGGGGGSADDSNAAGSFLPTLDGYTVTSASSITDAISQAAGDGADSLGNPGIAAAISRVDAFIACYQEVGAVAANIYTQVDLGSILGGNVVPSAGAVAVVNQDRVIENLLACASGSTAQGDTLPGAPTVCQGSGNFSADDDTFTYVYASTSAEFCAAVQNHFNSIN